jgi:hypothetical protein
MHPKPFISHVCFNDNIKLHGRGVSSVPFKVPLGRLRIHSPMHPRPLISHWFVCFLRLAQGNWLRSSDQGKKCIKTKNTCRCISGMKMHRFLWTHLFMARSLQATSYGPLTDGKWHRAEKTTAPAIRMWKTYLFLHNHFVSYGWLLQIRKQDVLAIDLDDQWLGWVIQVI